MWFVPGFKSFFLGDPAMSLSVPVTTDPIIFATLRLVLPRSAFSPSPSRQPSLDSQGNKSCHQGSLTGTPTSWLIKAPSSNLPFIGSLFSIGLNRVQPSPIKGSFLTVTPGLWDNWVTNMLKNIFHHLWRHFLRYLLIWILRVLSYDKLCKFKGLVGKE